MVRVLRVLIRMPVFWQLILGVFVSGILILAILVPWVLGLDVLVSGVSVPEVFVPGVLLLEMLSQEHWQDQE